MDWSLTLLPALVALAFLFLPGLLLALAAGQKGFEALGISPALSVALIALSAIGAPLLGLRWAPWIPFLTAGLLAALVYGLSLLLARRTSAQNKPAQEQATQLEPASWWSPQQGWAYAGLLLAFLLLGRNISNAIGDPFWISQTYDVNFHLNAVRYSADQGNASSLFIASMTSGDGPVLFYPAAWHGLASLVFLVTGADIALIANTLSLIIAAVIWPLSLIYLGRMTFRLTGPSLLATGAISAAYISFPLLLINFGVLYPNSLGLALLPLGLALLAQVLGLSELRRISLPQGLFLGILTGLALALAHPNMVMTLLFMAVPMILVFGLRALGRGIQRSYSPLQALAALLLSAALLWLVSILWALVRPPKESGGWEPSTADTGGLGEALLNNSLGIGNLWVISLLGLLGLFSIFHSRRRLIWLALVWAYTVYFYVAGRSMSWADGRDWVTGIWYHDPFRIAAILPVAAAPLALLGVDFIAGYLSKFISGLGWKGLGWKKEGQKALSLLVASSLLLLPLVWLTQSNTRLQDYIESTFWSYAPDLESPLLTPDEYQLLYALDDYVPEDATIIVNPWTGAGLAYAISGRKVTGYHTSYSPTETEEIVLQDLEQAGSDPRVCQALAEEKAYYAIYFGEREINEHISGNHRDDYPSLTYLADPQVIDAGGVAEVIYRSGGATLYRITACS
ncbi:MAG: DUF6541 family protein [Rothia sp. (in: high G+C Gram-positive bacteria)]|nr:DUF6541 family protein [Rothia sp. (in: high G+C Gram-positive bacteria)]